LGLSKIQANRTEWTLIPIGVKHRKIHSDSQKIPGSQRARLILMGGLQAVRRNPGLQLVIALHSAKPQQSLR